MLPVSKNREARRESDPLVVDIKQQISASRRNRKLTVCQPCRLDTLFEFTRSLQAFSNITEHTRRKLCKVMVFAQAEKAETILLQDNELVP